MSNIVPNNMSSVLDNPSDFLEFTLLQQFNEEGLPDFFITSPTFIEAVSLPPIDSSHTTIELFPRAPTPNTDNNYIDISNSIRNGFINLEIQNSPHSTIQINLNNTKNQINESNQNDSNVIIVDSNANIIKLIQAKKDLKELKVIKQRLKNEQLQLTKENDEIKREIIEYVKTNNIQFEADVIKSLITRKNSATSSSLTSISSPVPCTSTCGFDNPKRSRGRPHKDLKEAEEELEKVKHKLDEKQLRIASNNVASIKARENKKRWIIELCAKEQNLSKLNKDLNKQYRRNRKDILRIIKAAIRSAKKL